MNEEEKQWEKYLVKCPKCGNVFLPWKCLSIRSQETNWKTNCVCPTCKERFERDKSFINKK